MAAIISQSWRIRTHPVCFATGASSQSGTVKDEALALALKVKDFGTVR